MKKVLAVIFSLFYLATASGVGMNLHYCCGMLDKVELSYTMPAGHAACGMESAYIGNDCCKNVHQEFKITQAQNTVSDIAIPAVHTFAAILPSFPLASAPNFPSITKGSFLPHAPPFRETEPVYLKNCSFLI